MVIDARVTAAVLILSAWTSSVHGANRFFINSRTVAVGATGEEFALRADNDIALYGFSFGINYDQSALTVTAVTIAGTDAATADYFNGRIDAVDGLVGYGCVLDTATPLTKTIPAGTGRTLAKLVLNAIGAAGTSSQLLFENVNVSLDPFRIVKNVMTTTQGNTVVPSLQSGTVTIEDRTPVITSISNNAGLAGRVFQVQGNFFGEPGLEVRVCSAVASATLRVDGRTLDVTAPACGSEGPAEVRVCTIRGCDAEPAGFTYLPEDIAFLRGDANYDGGVDISDGVTILIYLFVGTIATNCPDAFDSNDQNSVSVSDAIFIFEYLLTDGPVIPPPFPTPGRDPTSDTLPKCTARP
jgi:hypothetical protein